MANFLPPAIIEIKALADKAIAEFKQVNGELEKMEKSADKAGGGISKLERTSKLATGALIGMGAAFAGFAAIGIKEAMDAEQVMAKLGATMSAVGVNSEANREKIQKLTESYISLGFADEAAAAGFENLLRVTGDVNKSQDLLALSADLARTKNIGLAEASGILAKASTGNAKAFKDAGIVLDTTIPKTQAVDKAFKELNNRIGSQAEAATKTFAVQLQIVKERFNDTAESVGSMLLPILKNLLETINKGVEFIKRNSEVFKILAGVIVTVTVALAAYNIGVKVSTAATKVWTAVTTAQKIATALLTGNMKALNTTMKANPIGLIFTAATLLIGAFTMLWNKSETFRKAVIAVAKAGITAFASIIPMIGQVGEAILKLLLTPLKTLLGGLSKLPGVGKYAKAGLDLLNKGLDGVSGFADRASAKAKELAGNLDKLNKPIKIGGGGIDIPDMGGGKGGKKATGGLSPEAKKANEKYMEAVKDLNRKIADAQKTYNRALAKAQEKYDEDYLDALKKRDETIANAQKVFNEKMGELNKKRAEDLAKLEKDNAKKITEIYKANAEKLRSIVQTSIDRLRDAYKSGTSFSVTDLFKGLVESGTQSADKLLEALSGKLANARLLAQKATQLATMGFSQTFIEQVVSAGPEIGVALADSIAQATPDTIRELQATFLSLESENENGLNALATTMNEGAKLATTELINAYKEAQGELGTLLAEQNQQYLEAQTEINKTFNEQMAEAEKARDEAIAQANKDFADAVAEASKTLMKSIQEAKVQLGDALEDIQREFADKLGNIQGAIRSTIKAIQDLMAAMSALSALTTKGSSGDSGSGGGSGKKDDSTMDQNFKNAIGGVGRGEYNVTINTTNLTSPTEVANMTIGLIKYGETVQVAGGALKAMMA